MNFKSEFELLEFAKGLIGKRFKDLDTFNLLSNEKSKKGKGILGQLVESGFFGYESNNRPEADFKDLGIELKVSGLKRLNSGKLVPKERLVLSKIDYNELIDEDFELSKFLFKNRKILMVWYEYDKKLSRSEMTIQKVHIIDLTKDLKIIKNDFNEIKKKVLKGQAHLLSEGDTMFLGACTKAANSKKLVSQPNSKIKAKPRAYSLKLSFMNGILNQKGQDEIDFMDILDFVEEKLKPYVGMKQLDIAKKIGLKISGKIPKNLNKILTDKIIGRDSYLKSLNIFGKSNYIIKNMPVDESNSPLERMSFRNLVLSEFKEPFDNSDWKIFFEEVTIIVLLYKGDSKSVNGERTLIGAKKLYFTDNDLEKIKLSYNRVKETIEKKDVMLLPFPNSFKDQILEIAPKGLKGADAYNNFLKLNHTKVCFMLNKNFVKLKID
jgi:DNA mismatch repair endonuclease MutH